MKREDLPASDVLASIGLAAASVVAGILARVLLVGGRAVAAGLETLENALASERDDGSAAATVTHLHDRREERAADDVEAAPWADGVDPLPAEAEFTGFEPADGITPVTTPARRRSSAGAARTTPRPAKRATGRSVPPALRPVRNGPAVPDTDTSDGTRQPVKGAAAAAGSADGSATGGSRGTAKRTTSASKATTTKATAKRTAATTATKATTRRTAAKAAAPAAKSAAPRAAGAGTGAAKRTTTAKSATTPTKTAKTAQTATKTAARKRTTTPTPSTPVKAAEAPTDSAATTPSPATPVKAAEAPTDSAATTPTSTPPPEQSRASEQQTPPTPAVAEPTPSATSTDTGSDATDGSPTS